MSNLTVHIRDLHNSELLKHMTITDVDSIFVSQANATQDGFWYPIKTSDVEANGMMFDISNQSGNTQIVIPAIDWSKFQFNGVTYSSFIERLTNFFLAFNRNPSIKFNLQITRETYDNGEREFDIFLYAGINGCNIKYLADGDDAYPYNANLHCRSGKLLDHENDFMYNGPVSITKEEVYGTDETVGKFKNLEAPENISILDLSKDDLFRLTYLDQNGIWMLSKTYIDHYEGAYSMSSVEGMLAKGYQPVYKDTDFEDDPVKKFEEAEINGWMLIGDGVYEREKLECSKLSRNPLHKNVSHMCLMDIAEDILVDCVDNSVNGGNDYRLNPQLLFGKHNINCVNILNHTEDTIAYMKKIAFEPIWYCEDDGSHEFHGWRYNPYYFGTKTPKKSKKKVTKTTKRSKELYDILKPKLLQSTFYDDRLACMVLNLYKLAENENVDEITNVHWSNIGLTPAMMKKGYTYINVDGSIAAEYDPYFKDENKWGMPFVWILNIK